MKNKKERELEIIKNIYISENIEIIPDEQPDFIINSDTEKFGVEVTEFYYNESTARLKNYKGYKEKILNSNNDSVLDRRDKGKLTRCQLYCYNEKNKKNEYLFDFIDVKYNDENKMSVLPNCQEIENIILNIIECKNKKSQKYEKFNYLELFIQDMENISFDKLEYIANSKKILNKINDSNFKRLYFLSGNKVITIGINPKENFEKYNKLR